MAFASDRSPVAAVVRHRWRDYAEMFARFAEKNTDSSESRSNDIESDATLPYAATFTRAETIFKPESNKLMVFIYFFVPASNLSY